MIRILPQDDNERNSYFTVERQTRRIRSCVEMLQSKHLEPANHEVLDGLYGPWKAYKCPKHWCYSFTEGLETEEERQKHIARHELPFRCHLESCFGYTLGFVDQPSLSQHRQKYHDTSKKQGVAFPSLALEKPLTLWEAAKKGNIKTVEAILDAGVDVNQLHPQQRSTALALAVKHDHMEVCQLLIARGATGNSDCRELVAAVTNQNLGLLTLLLSQLKSGYSAIMDMVHYAITLRDRAVLKTVLQSGKFTADKYHLQYAIQEETPTILEELMAHNDYYILLDQELVEPAVETGLTDMVEIVLSTGRPQITDSGPILKALRGKGPLIAKTILRYRNLRLSDDQLQECRQLSVEMGFEDVVAIIDRMKGVQRKHPPWDFLV